MLLEIFSTNLTTCYICAKYALFAVLLFNSTVKTAKNTNSCRKLVVN